MAMAMALSFFMFRPKKNGMIIQQKSPKFSQRRPDPARIRVKTL